MRMKSLMFAAVALTLAAPADAALAPGAKAPDFTTRGAEAGKVIPVHLAGLLKKGPVVLYFFPAAFTGGCNAEAHAFAEAIDKFEAAGATVLGVSADTVEQLQKFSSVHCAGKFAVASANMALINKYDVALPGEVTTPDGRKHAISNRTSYVIAPDGTVLYAYSDSNPADHVRNTLAAVEKWHAAHAG